MALSRILLNSMFPAWIFFHILFSIYILAYSLQKYKSRTVVSKYLHIGAFAAACLCATAAIICIVNHISASKMILWSSFFFGFNATIGLFFIPFVHKEWVVWKRLLTIGAWFNIAAVFTCWFLIFPSMISLLFFRISMGILLISVVAELRIAFFLSTSPPSSKSPSRWSSPKVTDQWMFPFDYFHILLCVGELPWKRFNYDICVIRGSLMVTVYFVLRWIQADVATIEALSEHTRNIFAIIILTSVWANALSVFGPTMMTRASISGSAYLLWIRLPGAANIHSSVCFVF